MIERKEYQIQQRVSLIQFLAKLPNFILITISAAMTSSLILWMDFIDSFGVLLNIFVIFVMTGKLKNNISFQYNYGVGKIEAISAIFGDSFTIISLCGLIVYSLIHIVHPKQPSEWLLYAIFLKIINVIVDLFVYQWQRRQCKKSGSRIFHSELNSAIFNIAFDAGTMISIAVVFGFRSFKFSWYISPILCIIIGTMFIIRVIHSIIQCLGDLLDKTVDEHSQMLILKALNTHYKQYRTFESVNSRRVGKYTHIDILVAFYDDTTYAEIEKFTEDIYGELRDQIPGCIVSVAVTRGAKSENRMHYNTAGAKKVTSGG